MIKVVQLTPVVVRAVTQRGIYHTPILAATSMGRQSLKIVHYLLDIILYITM